MYDFGLTYTDIRKKLNSKNEPYGFLGSEDSTEPADVTETIREKSERVGGRLNGRHQELLHYVSGEWLTRGAIGGETDFTTGLQPVSGLRLYLDYCRSWGDRRPCDALTVDTEYTINETTGAIVLATPLTEGQTLIAEYNHTATANCHLLRDIVKDLVAVEWARRLYPSDASFGRYLEWEKQAYSDLARLRVKDGEKLGIPMFDDLDLVIETEVARSVSEPYDADNGML